MRFLAVLVFLASLSGSATVAQGASAPDLPGDRADALAQSLMSPF